MAMDALTEGVIIVDDDEHIVLTNNAFEKKINCLPNQFMGKSLKMRTLI